jgi:hypothetical protein
MQQFCKYGSVRGAAGNRRPYRDPESAKGVTPFTCYFATKAPAPVRELYAELLGLSPEVVQVSAETLTLLAHYEARGVLGKRFRNDMLHIALATIAEADVLVSWNFRHIVRLDKIRLFNSVNLEQGYKTLPIHSSREVTTYGTQD